MKSQINTIANTAQKLKQIRPQMQSKSIFLSENIYIFYAYTYVYIDPKATKNFINTTEEIQGIAH